MNLGLLLPLGDSLKKFATHGQDVRFVQYYLKYYCQHFEKVLLFSYEDESYSDLPKNCFLVCPKSKLHRYVYGLILPFVHSREYRQCDVFRCFHPSATVPALVGKLFFGKKFVFNFNYDYQALAKIEGKSYLIPFLMFVELLVFKYADNVFVSDETMQKYVGKYVSADRITLVRNGADSTLFKPMARKANRTKIILSVGRLDPAKNYGQLIEAISKVEPKPKLILVGRGYLKKTLRDQAKKLAVNLEIIDMIPHDRLASIYNRADVYVQCSLREAPVKTLLEAMSCGRPCVGTNVPGIRNVINSGKNGLLVKLSVLDIKKGIETILANSRLAFRLGKDARRTIINKYNLQTFLQLETQILLSL